MNGDGASTGQRYRILLSDGKYSYAYGMLATQLNSMVAEGKLEGNTIIKLNKVVCNSINSTKGNGKEPKKILIILDLTVLVPGSEVVNIHRSHISPLDFIVGYTFPSVM